MACCTLKQIIRMDHSHGSLGTSIMPKAQFKYSSPLLLDLALGSQISSQSLKLRLTKITEMSGRDLKRSLGPPVYTEAHRPS